MEHRSLIVMPDEMNYTHWHAILKNEAKNRRDYRVPDKAFGARISINTKCLRKPRVFAVSERHPRWAIYVGCKYGQFPGTPYGNTLRPFDADGHKNAPAARTELGFRVHAEKLMLEPGFREQAIKDLRGKHLLCWCRQDGPERASFCHARVWLDIVNREEFKKTVETVKAFS